MMIKHSPDSEDPTLIFESAENSPLNTSVIDTFNTAYGFATIATESDENSAGTQSGNSTKSEHKNDKVESANNTHHEIDNASSNQAVSTGATQENKCSANTAGTQC